MTHRGQRSEQARLRRELRGQLRRLDIAHPATAFLAGVSRAPRLSESAGRPASLAAVAAFAAPKCAVSPATGFDREGSQELAAGSTAAPSSSHTATRDCSPALATEGNRRKSDIDWDDL